MAYFRRRGFRRNFRRKIYRGRRSYRRRFGGRRFVRRARRVVAAAAEKKYNFIDLATSTFSTIGTTWCEMHWWPSQGTNVLQRVGNKIAVTSISFRGFLRGGQVNGSADDQFNEMRIVCGMYRADPKVDTSTNASPIASSPSIAHLSTPISKDTYPDLIFKMYDKRLLLKSPGTNSIGYMNAYGSFSYAHKFKKPVLVTFDATTGFPDKNLYFSILGDSALPPSCSIYEGMFIIHYIDV